MYRLIYRNNDFYKRILHPDLEFPRTLPKNHIMKLYGLLPFLFLFFCSSTAISQQADATANIGLENSLLWKISGNGLSEPSYLFGTYHLMNDEFLKKIKGLKKALRSSEAVVGELVMTPELSAQLMPYMIMENTTLDSVLTPSQYDSVAAAVKENLSAPMFLLNKMKPIVIYTMLGAAQAQKSGLVKKSKGVPMDIFFQEEGKKEGKKIIGLETAKEQADILFNNYPVERQVELLMEFLKSGGQVNEAEGERLNECYTQQKLDCLTELFEKAGYSDAESLDLLNKRNIRWIPQLEKLMKEQSCFVAVGALHLTGKDGLIVLLRKQGYVVEPMNKKS